MRKFHELAEDDPVWTSHQPLTVGSMSRAMSDSKAALTSATKLAARVDEIEVEIDEMMKSLNTTAAALNSRVAKVDATLEKSDTSDIAAKIDTAGLLAKMETFSKGFHRRQHAAEVAAGSRQSFERYMLQIESEREMYRKRDAFDGESEPISDARFRSMYRVVK